jgi:hypothetical protein
LNGLALIDEIYPMTGNSARGRRIVIAQYLFRNLLLFAVLSVTSLACQRTVLEPGDESPGRLLFVDRFSDAAGRWTVQNRISGAAQIGNEAGVADGVYRMVVKNPNTDIWAMPGLTLGDVKIEVDAIKIDGDKNNRFGIICRATGGANFYVFMVSSDGYYGIGKIKGQDYQLLGAQALLPSDKIPKGTAYMHLRADCVKDRLALYVDGVKIAEVRDAEFTQGDVGLFAGAYTIAGTQLFFDNFSVYQP